MGEYRLFQPLFQLEPSTCWTALVTLIGRGFLFVISPVILFIYCNPSVYISHCGYKFEHQALANKSSIKNHAPRIKYLSTVLYITTLHVFPFFGISTTLISCHPCSHIPISNCGPPNVYYWILVSGPMFTVIRFRTHPCPHHHHDM